MLKTELTNTNAGLMAIQRAIAGENIIFTKLKIGDGILTNPDISNLENIIKEIKTFPLGVVKPESGEMLRVRANINNVGLASDGLIREYGLFAKFTNESEFLFAYLNVGENTTPLPAASSGRYDLNRDFVLNIGNNMNVTFNANGDLVYATLNDIKALDAKKEDAFSKKSGFNLDKTSVAENDNNKLFTALGALDLKNWLVSNYTTLMNNIKEALDTKIGTKLNHGGYAGTGQTLFNLIETSKNSLTSLINGKENSFSKNGAFNKNFGTELGTVLEGAKLAEALGLEYAGIVNNNNAKVAGKAYYCTSNKAIYKCTQNNSLNYIDANYFEGLSNDKLLGKLQNLLNVSTYTMNHSNYKLSFKRIGNAISIIISENESVPRSYLEEIIPIGIIPNEYLPMTGIVLTIVQAPKAGTQMIKFTTEGRMYVLYRDNLIYNNNIETSAFFYPAKYNIL